MTTPTPESTRLAMLMLGGRMTDRFDEIAQSLLEHLSNGGFAPNDWGAAKGYAAALLRRLDLEARIEAYGNAANMCECGAGDAMADIEQSIKSQLASIDSARGGERDTVTVHVPKTQGAVDVKEVIYRPEAGE